MMDNIDWTQELNLDLDKLIDLSNPDQKIPSDKLKLKAGERRFVTVLFIDMQDFTALFGQYDDNVVEGLINKLFTIFYGQIEKRGGWVEKFSGDAIMAAFGAKVAHEDDAVRAIDASLSILDSFKQIQPVLKKQGIEVDVRIGIHSGEVTKSKRAEFDVITGDTVNTAARLEQNADNGTILVSSSTKKFAGDRFVYVDHSDVLAKGKKNLIQTYCIQSKTPRKEKWQRSKLAARTIFVGREIEINQLREMYKKCCEYKPTGVTSSHNTQHVMIGIEGEAGMGKSRLVYEFLKENTQTEQVLKGSAVSFASRSYETIISMLMDILGLVTFGPEIKLKLESLLENLAEYVEDDTEIKKALPMLGFLLGVKYEDPRFEHLNPDQLQSEIFIAFKTFIQSIAEKTYREHTKPLILILEDFHWIDIPSKEALKFLVENTNTKLPLLLLVPYRLEGELLKVSVKRVESVELKLESLLIKDEISLIQGMLDTTKVPASLRKLVNERVAGNPYYIEELVHHLVDREIIFEMDGRWQFKDTAGEIEVPTSLRGLLLARIDTLDQQIKTTLQHASVLGRDFFYKTLKWIEGKIENGADPKTALGELVVFNFILTQEHFDPLYIFKHILTRDVAYDTLLHRNRKVLHRLYAEFIEEIHAEHLDKYYFELGEHWLAAGYHEKGIEYFLKAGAFAKKSYDNQKALAALSKAIDLMSDLDTRISQALRDRGAVFMLIGQMSEAKKDFDRSFVKTIELKDRNGEALSIHEVGKTHHARGKFNKALKWYHRALEIFKELGDRHGEAATLGNIGSIHHDQGRCEEALRFSKQAMEIFQEIGDRHGEADSISQVGIIHHEQGRDEEALLCHQRSLTIRRELDNRIGIASSLGNIGNIHFLQDSYEEALNWYKQALMIFSEIGNRRGKAMVFNNIGATYSNISRDEEALRYYKQALITQRELGDRMGIASSLGNIGNSHYQQGRDEEALECHQQSLEIKRDLGNRAGEAHSLQTIGAIHQDQFIYEEALNCYQTAVQIFKELGDRRGEAYLRGDIGSIHHHLGQFEKAINWYKQALAIFTEIGNRYGEAMTLNNIGVICANLSRHEEALRCSKQSLKIKEEMGNRQGVANSLFRIGNIYYHQDKFEEAENFFSKATTIREETEGKYKAVSSRSMQARVLIHLNNHEKARRISLQCIKSLNEIDPEKTNREMEPEQILFTHYLLIQNQNNQDAYKYLREAYEILKKYTDTISDQKGRQNVLNTPMNRPIVEAWKRYANRRIDEKTKGRKDCGPK
jgi:tetratricopeptide (TPR) repeat protein/class 3 adenylate cyclase